MPIQTQQVHVIHRWSRTDYQQLALGICRWFWHQSYQCLENHVVKVWTCLHEFYNSVNVVNYYQRRFWLVCVSKHLIDAVYFTQWSHTHELLWRDQLNKLKLRLVCKLRRYCSRAWTLLSVKHHCIKLMRSCQRQPFSCLQVIDYASVLRTIVEDLVSQKNLEILLITTETWWYLVDRLFKVKHSHSGAFFVGKVFRKVHDIVVFGHCVCTCVLDNSLDFSACIILSHSC